MVLSNLTVVCPIDFSRESSHAIRSALAIAGSPEKLHVIHVISPTDPISPDALLGIADDEIRLELARKQIEQLCLDHGAKGASATVLMGDPGMQIAEYATQHAASLIVIPSHGYHGVKRLLVGSVAERVIRYADCSVLVLRRTDAE